MFSKVSNGLLVTDFPSLQENLTKVLKASKMPEPFIEEGSEFNLL